MRFDCVSSILEQLSYDLEKETWKQNVNKNAEQLIGLSNKNKRARIFIGLANANNANANNAISPWNFLEIDRHFAWRHLKCSNVIGQLYCLLPILGVSLAGIRRSFVLILPNIGPWNKLQTLFQGPYESRSNAGMFDLFYPLIHWLLLSGNTVYLGVKKTHAFLKWTCRSEQFRWTV